MILDLVKKRYSCRGFSDKAIPGDIIRYILECGRLSPSGGNEQPWKFGVITDREKISELARAASKRYDQSWIAAAPLIIALCTQLFNDAGEIGMDRFPSYHDALQRLDRAVYTVVNMEEHQTKIPGEHMVLAALEHGVYSTWISCVDCEQAEQILKVEGYHVTNLIVFGYPKEARDVTPKKGLADITFTNSFDNPGLHIG